MPAAIIGGLGAAVGGISAAGAATAAGVAGAAISAGTALAGAVGGSGSQSSDVSAGQAQSLAAEQAAYDTYSTNETPYISTGTNALSGLADADGLNGATGYQNALASFEASPGYQYQVQQGLSAIDNGAASLGTLRSGNTIRAEQTLGSNLANQDFGNYVTRLNALAGLGQTATSALGSAGVSTGAGMASTDASAATAQANITGNATKGVTDAVTGLAGNSKVQNALSSLLTPASSNPGNANYVANSAIGGGGLA